MNFTNIDHATFAETITNDRCDILHVIEAPGANNTYVAVLDGIDVLIVTDTMTGSAVVIYPCSEDQEAGGSVHAHARTINAVADDHQDGSLIHDHARLAI
jgi:hypothetical protein